MVEQTDYPTIMMCVRPARAAVAYPTWFDWVHSARQALRSLSRIWGGWGSMLLPLGTDGRVPSALLPLLRHFDPDDVMLHELTLGDIGHGSAELVGQAVDRHKVDGETPEQTWSRIAGFAVDYRPDYPEALAQQIDAWCSPLRTSVHDERTFTPVSLHMLSRKENPGGHLALLPQAPNQTVYELDLSAVDPVIALMVESRVGAVADIDRDKVNIITLPVLDEDLPGLISLAITGGVKYNWDLHARYQAAIGVAATAPPPLALSEQVYLVNTPLGRTRHELAKINILQPPSTVCVIGDTPEDHALAIVCDRLFCHGAWIPSRLLDTDSPHRHAVAVALWQLISEFRPGSRIKVTSASIGESDLTAMLHSLEGTGYVSLAGSWPPGEPKLEVVSVDKIYQEKGWAQLADKRWFGTSRTVPSRQVAGELTLLTPIEPIAPSATNNFSVPLDWCVDVMVPNYQPPARTALGTDVLTQPTGGFREAVTRASRFGVSFSSRNMGLVLAGGPLERSIAQPLLRLPSAEQIFRELAAKQDAQVYRSSAGRRAANAVELWGSFPAITADLRGHVRQLLDAFVPPPKKENGDYTKGYAIRKLGYLSLGYAVDALGVDEHETRVVLDRLLSRRVLRRGLVLNCERCAGQAFYRIAEVGDDGFTCILCRNPNELSQARWYNGVSEPDWYYSLDQVARDLLTQHGDIPLLTAEELSRGSRTMSWAPELQVVFSDGDEAELDVALIIDGRIVVGEGKSNNQLKTPDKGTNEAAKRLVRAAQLLTADEIVLATSRPRWATGAKEAVEAAIRADWSFGPIPTVREMVSVGAVTP